ncbi:MAG: phosphotriesterase-related protein, partial [Eubacterium sp.]
METRPSADPSKTAIGHMCGNTDIDYQKAVLDQGVFVNFDRFGLEGEVFHTPTDDQRIDTLEKLAALGYQDQIMLSHDSVNYQLGRPNIMTPVMKKNMRHANIRRIGEYVIPEMK